eukprot:scaffold7443_cov54-Phaeocystis_antarctica.AAC.2
MNLSFAHAETSAGSGSEVERIRSTWLGLGLGLGVGVGLGSGLGSGLELGLGLAFRVREHVDVLPRLQDTRRGLDAVAISVRRHHFEGDVSARGLVVAEPHRAVRRDLAQVEDERAGRAGQRCSGGAAQLICARHGWLLLCALEWTAALARTRRRGD